MCKDGASNNPTHAGISFYPILKSLEPVGLLITISFAIAAFTDPTVNSRSYEFSVTAGIFFLFSFILGIARPYLEYQNRSSNLSMLLIMPFHFVRFSFYFCFFFGILFLLLYSYELVKVNKFIIEILRNMFFFFIFAISMVGLFSNVKNKIHKRNLKFNLFDIAVIPLMCLLFIYSSFQIYEVIFGNSMKIELNIITALIIGGIIGYALMLAQVIIMLIDTYKWTDRKIRRKGLIMVYFLLALIIIPVFSIIILVNYGEIISGIERIFANFLRLI